MVGSNPWLQCLHWGSDVLSTRLDLWISRDLAELMPKMGELEQTHRFDFRLCNSIIILTKSIQNLFVFFETTFWAGRAFAQNLDSRFAVGFVYAALRMIRAEWTKLLKSFIDPVPSSKCTVADVLASAIKSAVCAWCHTQISYRLFSSTILKILWRDHVYKKKIKYRRGAK